MATTNSTLIKQMRSVGLFLLFTSSMMPAADVMAQSAEDYQLQPGDQIEVSVWGEEELQRTVLVRPDGKFAFPMAGEITAAGRSPLETQIELTRKLLTFIPEAVVTVSVTGFEGNKIYVIGQVEKPGSFVMNPKINVLQALSLAGGTTPFAALDDIIIIRGTGASQRVFSFAYNRIIRGRNLEQNIELESGDVVVVP
jgi:polysaccharide export outer membrane protein